MQIWIAHFNSFYFHLLPKLTQADALFHLVFLMSSEPINCGELEGTDETDAKAMQLVFQAIVSGNKGTESFQDFLKLCCDFCDMVVEEHKGKNVLIVTHTANTGNRLLFQWQAQGL